MRDLDTIGPQLRDGQLPGSPEPGYSRSAGHREHRQRGRGRVHGVSGDRGRFRVSLRGGLDRQQATRSGALRPLRDEVDPRWPRFSLHHVSWRHGRGNSVEPCGGRCRPGISGGEDDVHGSPLGRSGSNRLRRRLRWLCHHARPGGTCPVLELSRRVWPGCCRGYRPNCTCRCWRMSPC